MQHVWGTGEVHTMFWWGYWKERNHLEDSGTDGTIMLRYTYRKQDGGAWTELFWLRIGTGDGYLSW